MANTFFQFKRFIVHQHSAAMKVGTDGVLLGAWCRVTESDRRILDIGTGTGLVALMVAQRGESFAAKTVVNEGSDGVVNEGSDGVVDEGSDGVVIDALEIDVDSFRQAVDNFSLSLWSTTINAVHGSLQNFSTKKLYDHIVSNPPYFNNSLQSPDSSRTTARHTCDLNYYDLSVGVDRLLSVEGRFSLIIPFSEAEKVVVIFENLGLYLHRRTDVLPCVDRVAKRSLLEFGRTHANAEYTSLIIEKETRHDYTDEYMALTKDFYLRF